MNSAFELGKIQPADAARGRFHHVHDRGMGMDLHVARHTSLRAGECVQLGRGAAVFILADHFDGRPRRVMVKRDIANRTRFKPIFAAMS